MAGDFTLKQFEQEDFFKTQDISPKGNKQALDLGAGHGLQTVSLVNLGFQVTAVDFNNQLLSELEKNTAGKNVSIVNDDIRNVNRFKNLQPELIICWGDTLTHLPDRTEVAAFLDNCISILSPGGKLLLSFRDYSTQPEGMRIEIPVKSDKGRELTCILEYGAFYVTVTDVLKEKVSGKWIESKSSYQKTRVSPTEIQRILQLKGLKILYGHSEKGINVIIAQHKN